MTTATGTRVLDHTGDAAFRAWGSGFAGDLAAAGLVQTADTGQINWTTVTRPSANTAGGYEIWRFSDSSLYLKIEYGTGGSATVPQMWITVGTGSNGSGTITGQTNTRNTWAGSGSPTSTATAYTNYVSHITGALSVCFAANSTTSSAFPMGYLVVGKTVDGAGASTTTGFGVLRHSAAGGPSFQSVRIASTAVTYTDTTNYSVIPGNPSSSLVGADIQAYAIWLNVPQVVPFAWANIYVITEITELNTFSVAMVGAVSHDYLALGQLGSSSSINGQSGATYTVAMVYE